MANLTEDGISDGSLIQTGGLSASPTGTRVRISGGKLTVTDGPLAEAKEVVGGYAVLEAQSRDEALEAVRAFLRLHQQHWPAWEGECEIRQLVDCLSFSDSTNAVGREKRDSPLVGESRTRL